MFCPAPLTFIGRRKRGSPSKPQNRAGAWAKGLSALAGLKASRGRCGLSREDRNVANSIVSSGNFPKTKAVVSDGAAAWLRDA